MGAVLVMSLLIFITPLSIFNYETYKAHASYSSEEFQQLLKKLNDLNKSLTLLSEVHKQLALKLDNLSSFTALNNRIISQVNAEARIINSNISQVNETLKINILTINNQLQNNIRQSQKNVINQLKMEVINNITISKQELRNDINSVNRRINFISGRNIITGCAHRRSYTSLSLRNQSANFTVSHSRPTNSVSYSIE